MPAQNVGDLTSELEDHADVLAELASYVFGALEADDALAIEHHVKYCQICRRELPLLQDAARSLEGMPPEAFLDGPPEDAELLIAKTLRRARDAGIGRQSRGPARTVRWLGVAAALVGLSVAGGFLLGHTAERTNVAGPGPQATVTVSAAAPTAAGSRTFDVLDQQTGAELAGLITPAKGWLRLSVTAKGIPAGQRCVLYVTPKHGSPVVAGSWLVSAAGSRSGTQLQGTALVDLTAVGSISVKSTSGKTYATVTL
ncbi:MAG: anti-sigma factor [Frankiales bacterium]|nr:anti-sigma factor [Frankiales bacterium]